MTVVDATAIIGAVAAVVGTLVIPPYLARRKAKHEKDANEDITWIGINKAIVKERDRLAAEVDKKDAEIEQKDAAHAAEMAALEAKHQAQIADYAKALAECQEKHRRLGFELYELQKRLPPNLRPGPDDVGT